MSDAPRELLRFGPFTVDLSDRVLWRGGELVELTPKAFDLLVVLVQNPGRVLSKSDLIERVWPDAIVEEANLSNQVHRLRAVLGEGEGEAPYIDTLSRRGYRFVAPVTRVVPEAVPVTVAPAPPAADAPVLVAQRTPLRRRVAIGLMVVTAVVALLTYDGATRRSTATSTTTPIQTLAVLPFTALSPPARDEPLELGMTDAVITQLTNVRQVTVRPTSAVLAYTRIPRDVIAIGREQRVDAILEGKIQRTADRIRVTVQLLRASDARPLWAETFDQPARDLFAIQDAISGRVVDALRVRLSAGERAQLTAGRRPPIDAYDAYVRGLYHVASFGPDAARLAEKEFRRALTIEPDYVEASAGLAAALANVGFGQAATPAQMKEAQTLVARALRLKPDSMEAHQAAMTVALYVDWDWDAADSESRWMIAHAPNDARAHSWRGWYLTLMGRFAEAVEPLRAAQQLDPLSVNITTMLGYALIESGEAEGGLAMMRRAVDAAPSHGAARSSLAEVLFARGRPDEALEILRREPAQLGPPVDATLGYLLARTGRQHEARQVLQRLTAGPFPAPAYLAAVVQSGLGDTSGALANLERAYDDHSAWIVFLKSQRSWDSMRGDPRFQSLLRRVSLDS
jgi:DNA-binding winged helix-turn-helix (wHTH) protein/TolB-like protein/Flp pilus assembly protein TadD